MELISHSYGVSLATITQHYLPPDTSEHTPPEPQPDRPVLDLPTPEGWKAELTVNKERMWIGRRSDHVFERPQ